MSNGVKAKKRMIHVTFQTLGGCFILLGMVFVVANKIVQGESVIPHTVHSIFGNLALVGVLIQVIVGRMKTTHSTKRRYSWHGKLGLLTYDVGMLSMITGLLSWTVTVTSIVLAFLLVGIWISVSVHFGSTPDVAAGVSGIHEIELMELADNSSQLPNDGLRKTPPRRLTSPPRKIWTGSEYFDEER